MGIEQMDAESVETVAGVVRMLRREAELAPHLGLEAVLIIILIQAMARRFSLSVCSDREGRC